MNILISGGGLDSTALTIIHSDQIGAVYHVDYHHKAASLERAAVKAVWQALGKDEDRVVCLQNDTIAASSPNSLLIGTGYDPVVRGRNLQLLTTCVARAISQHGTKNTLRFWFGLLKEPNQFYDATKEYCQSLDTMFAASYGLTPNSSQLVRVYAPLIDTPKLEAMHQATQTLQQRGLSTDLLWETSFTCWTPVNGKACGVCKHCTKKAALRQEYRRTYEVS